MTFSAKYLFALLTALFTAVSGVVYADCGIKLLSKAPSDTAIFFGFDIKELEKELQSGSGNFKIELGKIPPEKVLLTFNRDGRRGAVLAKFADQRNAQAAIAAWKPYLSDPERSRWQTAYPQPDVAALYFASSKLPVFANASGFSGKLNMLPQKKGLLAFGMGKMKLRKTPGKEIREFFCELFRSGEKIRLEGIVFCKDQMNASFLQMTFMATLSVFLQTQAGMLPEEAGAWISRYIKVVQKNKCLEVSCPDVRGAVDEIIRAYVKMPAKQGGQLVSH